MNEFSFKEMTSFMYLLDLFEERGEKGQCDLVCVEHLWMIGLMVVMLMPYFHVVECGFSSFGSCSCSEQ